MNKFQEPLEKLFDKYRVLFWYDEDIELRDEFDSVEIDGVEKLVVSNNEFGVKYKVCREFSDKKFLLYFEGSEPEYLDDWLLDLKLANYTFRTTPEAIVLDELDLDYRFKDFITQHKDFFNAKDRKEKFKKLLVEENVTEGYLKFTILKVIISADAYRIEDLLLKLFSFDDDKLDKVFTEIGRFNLVEFFWSIVKKEYNYSSNEPSLYSFILELFKSVTTFISDGTLLVDLSPTEANALMARIRHLFSRWKSDKNNYPSFIKYSEKAKGDLPVEETLMKGVDLSTILDQDNFESIERYVIRELMVKLTQHAISHNDLESIIKSRETSLFYDDRIPFYETLLNASRLQWEIERLDVLTKPESLTDWAVEYSKELYKVDLHYRKFINSYQLTGHSPIFQELFDKFHNMYSNNWLLDINDSWQKTVDSLDSWNLIPGKRQRDFYYNYVKPLINKGQRVVVIISDAMRYEIGAEYNQKLNSEKVYDSKLEYLMSELPSYTQLGMASLLPNSELKIKDDANVKVDGINSDGTSNRTKILNTNSGVSSIAISYNDIMKLNAKTDGRKLLKEHNLIYIYHNKIDKTGDDKLTEESVFSAVDESIIEIEKLLSRLYSMNATNYFITSDHGFIYQAKELEESDYIESSVSGDIWKQNRRFFIGQNLENHQSYKEFKSSELGINGDFTCMFPKSINRVRVKGAGSKFVHGGTSLQEVIIPVLKVTRKREAIRKLVDIDIIKGRDEISSAIKPISFIQSEAIAAKVLPRTIKAAFYNEDKTVCLSDEFEHTFDYADSLERQREKKFTFHLSSRASDEFNNHRIILVMHEAIDGTSDWKEYKTFDFKMSMSTSMDFDF